MRSTILCVVACLTSAAAAASTPYFVIPEVWYRLPSGWHGYNNTFELDIIDPNSATNTTCDLIWNFYDPAPSAWQNCDDPTFSWRFDMFSETAFNVQIKHQYRSAGIPCLSSTDSQCNTARGYINVYPGSPGYGYECGSSGTCVTSGSNVKATITSSCGSGCALMSGAD